MVTESTIQKAGAQADTAPMPWYRFVGYGAGDAGNNLSFSLTVSFLALYYTDVAGITPAAVGVLFLVTRIVDAFADLAAGSVIDRTKTRWGKFRPFVLFGSIPLIILAILSFSMPEGMRGHTSALIWAAVTYGLMGIVFSFVNIPYGSLASAMTQNPQNRSRLGISRSIGAAIMQVTIALAISPAIQANKGNADGLQSSLTSTIIILGVIAFLLYLFTFFTAKETVHRTVDKVGFRQSMNTLVHNKALMMLGVTSLVYLIGLFAGLGITAYYARDVMGNANYLALYMTLLYGMVLVVGWFIPTVVNRIGKPLLFQIGTLFGAAGGVVLAIAPAGSVATAALGFALFGISSGVVNSLMWNLEADTVEYGEWKSGLRTEGTTYAVFSFTRKLAQALGGAAGLWIIGGFGYVGGAASQSPDAQWGIRLAIGFVPAAVFLAAAILMQFYPLSDRRHKEIVAELHARRASTNA